MSGSRYERDFVRMFNDTDDWWAQRAAASGAGGDADLPDVTFAQGGIAFAGELKTTAAKHVYLTEREVDELRAYADAYGQQAVAIGRFKSERAFYVWNPDDMYRTDAGSYRGHPADRAWAAKIADPDGAASGIYPAEISPGQLREALEVGVDWNENE